WPQELPVSANPSRNQQSRWSTGSFQTAARVLWPVVRSRLGTAVKFQATMHLLGYVAPIAMLAQIACYPLLLIARAHGQPVPGLGAAVGASFMSLAPTAGMAVAPWRRGRGGGGHLYWLPGRAVLGARSSATA